MVESGDWLVPRYRGEPFYDKPALAYWSMAAAMSELGPSVAAARAVSVAAALGLVAVSGWLGASLFGRRAGVVSAAVVATTALVMVFARVAMSDMLLAFLCTAAVALAVAAEGRWPLWLGAGGALGLGFLAKGPVALVLAGPGVALSYRRAARRPAAWAALLAGLVAAGVGLGWFVALWQRVGPEPIRWFFLRENLQRFAAETYDADRPPLYYLGAFVALGLPWSVVFPRAAWTLRRGERFLLAWLALMLLPLSLSRGKIDYYLLPLIPATSIVVARWLCASEAWTAADRAWARAGVVVACLTAAAAPLAAGRLPPGWGPGPAVDLALCAAVLAVVIAGGLALRRPSADAVGGLMGAAAVVVFGLLLHGYLPAFRAAQPNEAVTRDVARERRYRPDARLVFCRDLARVHRDVLFAARHAAVERCDLWALATDAAPWLLLLTEDERSSLAAIPGVRAVADYAVVPATALTLRGLWEGVRPERQYLVANYETRDPIAEIKRKKDRKRALREGS